jgi:heptosyltransferase-2
LGRPGGDLTRSLIIAPQWIGDAVMTEPLMRRLATRGERLTVGALPWVAPVYQAMPQVAEVIEFPFAHGGLQFKARRSLAQQFAKQVEPFDTAYVLPNSLKSALLPFLANISKRVGYLGEARIGLLTHRLKNPKNKPPMVAFYSALSGASDVASDRPQLQLDATQTATDITPFGLNPQAYVVMAPGAEFGPAKRWPTAHFGEVARRLSAECGLRTVLLGSGKEATLCDEIQAVCPDALNLAGKTQLRQALSIIAASKNVVSNDSGLMHVAAAFGVPQVAVFGSSSPLHTPPLSDKAQVLWLKNDTTYQPALDCAPCFERECALGHMRCLNDVRPDQVLAAISTV